MSAFWRFLLRRCCCSALFQGSVLKCSKNRMHVRDLIARRCFEARETQQRNSARWTHAAATAAVSWFGRLAVVTCVRLTAARFRACLGYRGGGQGPFRGLLGEHALRGVWPGRQRLRQVQRHREEAARTLAAARGRRAGGSSSPARGGVGHHPVSSTLHACLAYHTYCCWGMVWVFWSMSSGRMFRTRSFTKGCFDLGARFSFFSSNACVSRLFSIVSRPLEVRGKKLARLLAVPLLPAPLRAALVCAQTEERESAVCLRSNLLCLAAEIPWCVVQRKAREARKQRFCFF